MAPGARRRPVPAINTAIASYHNSQPGTSQATPLARPRIRTKRASSSRSRSPLPSPIGASSTSHGRDSASMHDQDAPDDDDESVFYVQAMHDFDSVATEVTCLSFRAGQIIRVYNRHETGWWDGECNDQRGWFPSNYVNTQITQAAPRPRSSAGYSRRNRSITPSLASSSARGSMEEARGYPTQLVSLVQALSLLQNAVRARRITHFQPSTACVISCVRSVLSATDCLGRDSSPLMAFPRLAAARKVVLSDLARLVAQTRKSSEIDDIESLDVEHEMDEMMRLGETVYQHVRGFLDVASDCGLELPERRPLSPAGDEPYERYLSPVPSATGHPRSFGGSIHDDNDVTTRAVYVADGTTTSSPNSSLGNGSRSRSLGDLRQPRDASPDPSNYPSAAAAIAAAYTKAAAEREQREASLRNGSTAPSEGDAAVGSQASSEGSMETAPESGTDAGSFKAWPQGPTPAADVKAVLRQTHDRLISIIAAFIGAVHSHTQNAHASSKGHLIEMTRETVDQVRALIALVDSVMATPDIAASKARELVGLEACKTSLFACTSALVDSIRAITSLGPSENEDEEKGVCLQAATGALRAGQDCVTSMKLCLTRRRNEEPFMVYVLPPPTTAAETVRNSIASSGYSYAEYADAEGDGENEYVNVNANGYEEPVYAESPISEGAGTEIPSPYDGNMHDAELPPLLDDQTDDPTLHVPRGPQSNVAMKEYIAQQRPLTPRTSSPSPPPRESPNTPVAGTLPRSAPNIFVQHVSHDGELEGERMQIVHKPDTDDEGQSGTESVTDAESRNDRGYSTSPPTTLNSADSLAAMSTQTGETEEGAQIPQVANSLVEKMRHGDLPSVPSSASSIKLANETLFVSPRPSVDGHASIKTSSEDLYGWLLGNDYDPPDLSTNGEGVLNGGTLDALVEKMSSHRAPPDQTFSRSFMLTFRLFTTPADFLQQIVNRFETRPPSEPVPNPSEYRVWQDRKQLPVRMRVLNLLKLWLEGHWNPDTDDEILPQMLQFVREKVIPAPVVGPQGKRLAEIIEKRRNDKVDPAHRVPRAQSAERLRPTGAAGVVEPPTPQLDRTTLSRMRKGGTVSVTVSDFDALELARQLTIKESRLYCAIRPEELLASGQAGVRAADSVRAVTQLSTSITGWVTECLLDEPNTGKRAKLLKFFILLADKCLALHNFSTLRAVMAALDSSTIARLSKTWAGVSAKYQAIMENLRKVVDHSRNHAEYRGRLRNCSPPAVPFLGIYLTDIIFCREGNPATRASPLDTSRTLLNFHRYSQLARILHDMQRFQRPYNLLEIDEMQRYLDNEFGDLSKGTDLQDLYRRSLLVEPRQPNDRYHNEKGRDLFAWTRLGGFGGGSS